MYVSPESPIFVLVANIEFQTDGSQVWEDRINSLVDRMLQTFFPDNIAYEPSCEGRYSRAGGRGTDGQPVSDFN